MKKLLPAVAVALVLSFVAWGNPIRTWLPGDIITAADLNSALGHIHSTMVGGHGARLVNGDVAATANIAVSKLADGTKVTAKAWAKLVCDGVGCTVASQFGTTGSVGGIITSGVDLYLQTSCASSNQVALVVSNTTSSACVGASGVGVDHVSVQCTAQPVSPNIVVFCQ